MATTLVQPKPATDLKTLSQAVKPGRNRAVDAYRMVAMLAVAVGHWLVIVAYRGEGGEVVTGNGLAFLPSMQPITWLFQVMPLFFVVGGFASAASLDSRSMGRSSTPAQRADWIAGRMARLLPPVAVLGGGWLAAIALGGLAGASSLVNAGAVAAMIPLWFLANYTADVILAPHVLPLFRRSPGATAAVGGGVFLILEILRLNGEHHISHINWILGWFLFQMAGFAWADGLLPKGRRLVVWAAGLWLAAIVMVTVGPWSVSMVHFPGIADSPTHPPTLALLVFGAAQSATAIALAPRVTRWLENSRRAWSVVVAGNSMAMTIYLWHMTAAVVVIALFDQLGLLSSALPGTGDWWLAKVPFTIAASLVMALIVPFLARVERSALLTRRGPWTGSPWLMIGGAVAVSFALKGVTSGSVVLMAPCFVVVIAASAGLTKALGRADATA